VTTEPYESGAADGPLTVTTLFPRPSTGSGRSGRPSATLGIPTAAAGRPIELRQAFYADSAAARIAKASGAPVGEIRAIESPPDQDATAALSDAEVVVALDLPSDIEQLAPRLRWVQAYGAGVGQLINVLPLDRMRLTTAAGVAAPAIAEFVLARLLQVVCNLREIDARQVRQEWATAPSNTLQGRTILIVGLGAIGAEVARLARTYGMRIVGIRRRPERTPAGADIDAVHGPDDLMTLLPQADVVLLSAAATTGTAGMIGARELAAMKQTAILINVARGSLVDEDALVAALRARALAAAVLDVTVTEPLPAGHPLWGLDNVYLSPHSAPSGGDYLGRFWPLFSDNLERYAHGRPLRNLVDSTMGY
jgi:phosphoglycerate dehydrogenase-like enzyme